MCALCIWLSVPLCPCLSQKRQKEEVVRAAIRFKSKPREGIAHLVRIGRCEDTPTSIAAVFHELQDVLDKTMIGDYMGGEKDMNIKVHSSWLISLGVRQHVVACLHVLCMQMSAFC